MPAPLADRGLVRPKHPAPAAAAMIPHQTRVRDRQRRHRVPAHPMTARHSRHRHVAGIGRQPPRHTGRDAALQRRVILQEPPTAAVAVHPPPAPHQRGRPARDPQVPDPLGAPVMDPPASLAAVRAHRPRRRRAHPHHQPPDASTSTPSALTCRSHNRTDTTPLAIEALQGSASPKTDPSRASTHLNGPSAPPHPTKPRSASLFAGPHQNTTLTCGFVVGGDSYEFGDLRFCCLR